MLKWNCLGDSITTEDYGTPYHKHIQKRMDILVRNYAISGSRVARHIDSDTHMCERYKEMDDDADIITVFAGTNDFKYVKIGSFYDESDDTFYGALHILIKGLINKYPTKKIGYIMPLQRKFDSEKDRYTFKMYLKAIEEVCKYYSIPTLDLYTKGGLHPNIDKVNELLFTNADGLHPNSLGHEMISTKIENFIKTL